MRYTLILLLLIPFGLKAQFAPGSWKLQHSYQSPGEYRNDGYDSINHQAYHTINIVPQAFTGQPPYVQFVAGGAHDAYMVDTLGNYYWDGSNEFGQDGPGNTTGSCTGCMVLQRTDSAGNNIPPVRQILSTGNNGTTYLCTYLLTTVASGGFVLAAGALQNGMRGNGTSGPTAQSSFVYVPMPGGTADTVTKIEGIYGIIALTTKDSIICWGSSIGNSTKYIHLAGGWKAYDVASNGIAFWALADSSGTKGIFSWSPIFTTEPVYQGQGFGGTSHSTPTRVDKNVFFSGGPTKMMFGGRYPVFVTCNNEATYFKCNDGTLWDVGGNAVGEIGNGKQTHWATYSTPYSWDQGLVGGSAQDTIYQDTVYNVAPGITDWDTVYTGFSNAWSVCAIRNNGAMYQWGRNKGAQVWNGQIDCDYTNGNVRATYPDFLNVVYPDSISWPGTAVTIQQTFCPYCILNPSGSPCNLCTYNSAAPPSVTASSQTLSSSVTSTRINCIATAASTYYINTYRWTQLTGPPAIIQFPGSPGTLVSNITGTSTFQVTVTDNNQRTATTTLTLTVGNSGIGPILPGQPVRVVSLDTIIRHDLLVKDANYYPLDTLLLPVNSMGTFNLFFFAYDTVHHYTRSGQETVTVARIGTIYQAPYIMTTGGNNGTGESTEMLNFVVTLVNGLPLVRVDGFANSLINWHVIKDQKITPL